MDYTLFQRREKPRHWASVGATDPRHTEKVDSQEGLWGGQSHEAGSSKKEKYQQWLKALQEGSKGTQVS